MVTARGLLRRLGTLLVAGVAGLLLVGIGPARADLATFGYGNARLGSDPAPAGISGQTARRLRLAWRTNIDGAIDGQPLSLDGVRVGGRVRDVVLAGTEHGQVVALDAHNGGVLWRRQVGERTISPDCDASPDAVFGVTGTLTADPAAGRVYAVDADGEAWALSLADGGTVPGWPVRVHPRGGAFVWSASTLSRGWLYVPVASLCDTGFYLGGITAVNTAAPAETQVWHTTAGTSSYAGGIWGWGGVSVDAGTGDVYAASGNSLGTSREDVGYAENVIALTQRLTVLRANDPLRPPFTFSDRDFGTTPVLFHAHGCPAQLVAINKDGELFVYDRARLGSGPRQRLRVAGDSPVAIPLYGVPAYDPATRTLVLVSPSNPPHNRLHAGVQAFRLAEDCRFVPRWNKRFDQPNAGSAPTIAGGVVYIGSGRNGWLRAFALRDGIQLWARHVSTAAVFAAPTVDRGTLLVGDWAGFVSAFRPGR